MSNHEDQQIERFLTEMERKGLSRRELLRRTLAGGAALTLPALIAACGGDDEGGGEAAATSGGATTGAGATTGEAAVEPKRGGRIRMGVVGGGNAETLDFNQSLNEIDVPRTVTLFEGLTDYDTEGKPVNVLAEELTPNEDGSQWTARLVQGVEFHDGKTMTADDVIYSFQYLFVPDNKAQGAAALAGFLTAEGLEKVDENTVRFNLDRPNAFWPAVLANRAIKIMPDGFTREQHETSPIGTGPFKFDSWTRGERSLFLAHRNYRIHGGPYVDELEMISINEPSARVNALIGGEIDALSQLDPKLISSIEAAGHTVLDKPSGAHTCQYMQLTAEPFTDNRVRQALRLAIDRQQIVDNALAGHGKVGNDLPCWFDPDYNSELPQREYDPEQAKSLLQQAGQENLTVELHTAETAPAMLESSTLFAEQAKAAGITVNLKKYAPDQYWSGPYLKVPFANTNWGGRPLSEHYVLALTQEAPYNETVWKRPEWDKLVQDAFATPDEAQRRELMFETQKFLYDEGGYIVWGFLNTTDAVSNTLKGIVPSVIRPLGYYNFTNAYYEE